MELTRDRGKAAIEKLIKEIRIKYDYKKREEIYNKVLGGLNKMENNNCEKCSMYNDNIEVTSSNKSNSYESGFWQGRKESQETIEGLHKIIDLLESENERLKKENIEMKEELDTQSINFSMPMKSKTVKVYIKPEEEEG